VNHRKDGASIFPPITITISPVSLISGSKPKLPPGDDSNMNPKSEENIMLIVTNKLTHKTLSNSWQILPLKQQN